MLSVAFKML